MAPVKYESWTTPGPMTRKFMQAEAASASHQGQKASPNSPLSKPQRAYSPFQAEYYFFYGSLMDPKTLQRVLHLREAPKMRPAKVIGYHTELWGPYPALLEGPPLHLVEGLAYEIVREQHSEWLKAYETDAYRLEACLIDILDGVLEIETVEGSTFLWNGEPRDLRAGEFNLKQYLREESLNKLD